MSRHLVSAGMALAALLGVAQGVQATTVYNVTALPLPHVACPGVTTSAIPNDSTTDWAAFDCAVKLIPADGGTIYVPAGTFNLHLTLSILNKNLAIRGEGQQVTRLVWNHGGDGLFFESTASGIPPLTGVNYTLAVRSLSLIKSSTDGGAAIFGKWVKPTWHGVHGIVTTTINDVHIGTDPWPSGSVYWHYGIRLQNPTTPKISMFNIQGAGASGGVAAIQIHGDSAVAGKAIGTQIRNGTILKYVRGIETKDIAEGLHVQEVAIRETSWGIQMTDGSGTSIANNYISARTAGIETTNTWNMRITNNTIDQFEDLNFIGIFLISSIGPGLSGNSVYSPGTGIQPRNGIVLHGTMYNAVVEGNTTMNMNSGVWVTGGGVTSSSIIANINRNASNPVLDWGAGNYVAHNH